MNECEQMKVNKYILYNIEIIFLYFITISWVTKFIDF